jgi:hypothetical protein
MGESVPELPARNRIDAGSGFIKQKHTGLRHECTGEREFLLHSAAQTSGQTIRKAVHVEHPQIAVAAFNDLFWRNAAQIADIAYVLGNAEIRV